MLATQIFVYVQPWGFMIQFGSYFSNGLVQPPTSFEQGFLFIDVGGFETCSNLGSSCLHP